MTVYHAKRLLYPVLFLKKVQEKKQSGLDLTAGTVYFLEGSIC